MIRTKPRNTDRAMACRALVSFGVSVRETDHQSWQVEGMNPG